MRRDFRTYGIEIVPDGFTARVNCLWGVSIGDAVREVFRVMRSGAFCFQKYVIRFNDAPAVIVKRATSERRAVDYLYKQVVGCGEEQFAHQVKEHLATR